MPSRTPVPIHRERPFPGGFPTAAVWLGLPGLLSGCGSAPPALIQPGWGLYLLGSAVLHTALVAGLLWLWERRARARRMRDGLLRELRYLRTWESEEGILRKTGLLRDLNALSAVPVDLEGVVLPGADLSGVCLSGCNLRAANLAKANLHGAELRDCDLFGADLSGADLTLADLYAAELRGCNLDGAALARSQLSRANLHRASLVGANLTGAELDGTRLSLARFAQGGAGSLSGNVHPSVEDWIRERLDSDGRYRAEPNPRDQTGEGDSDEKDTPAPPSRKVSA